MYIKRQVPQQENKDGNIYNLGSPITIAKKVNLNTKHNQNTITFDLNHNLLNDSDLWHQQLGHVGVRKVK